MRHMSVKMPVLPVCVLGLVLAGCTSASSAGVEKSSGGAASRSIAAGPCAGHFTHVRATQTASLGELRSAGPRPLNTPDRFRSLPDDTSVTECLVPLATHFGVFIVYPDGQTQQFSTQNVADKIVPVS